MPHVDVIPFLLAAALQTAATPAPPASQPDVAIFANVHARVLRFEQTGTVNVEVHADVNGRPGPTVSHSDRTNFPDPAQPHVTYRDIGMILTITSTLPDIETILDEALAEPKKPTTDQRRK
jgi:hypothetical protein